MVSLAIGVVSHVGSRYSDNQGAGGLGQQLAKALTDLGTQVEVRINTEDAGHRYRVEATPEAVQASLTEQIRIHEAWSGFLRQQKGLGWWLNYGLRHGRRGLQKVFPPPVSMISRLLNIEASHRDLLEWGDACGSDWTLILEDDAKAENLSDTVRGVNGIIRSTQPPSYVNLSASFSVAELGVEHLLTPIQHEEWQGSIQRAVLRAEVPITNTVCAILYRSDFARTISRLLDELPMEPVLPIDWKLNAALMLASERGDIEPGACWQVEPAPILQMSMR